MLDKLYSDATCSVAGYECTVNKLTKQPSGGKKEEIYQSVHEAPQESAKLTLIVHDETVETTEKWLNLWI